MYRFSFGISISIYRIVIGHCNSHWMLIVIFMLNLFLSFHLFSPFNLHWIRGTLHSRFPLENVLFSTPILFEFSSRYENKRIHSILFIQLIWFDWLSKMFIFPANNRMCHVISNISAKPKYQRVTQNCWVIHLKC